MLIKAISFIISRDIGWRFGNSPISIFLLIIISKINNKNNHNKRIFKIIFLFFINIME